MTFEYENLLLLKSIQNKVAQVLWSLSKTKQVRHIYIPGAFWDKVIDFTDYPVVQCDVQVIKNTSFDNDDKNDGK